MDNFRGRTGDILPLLQMNATFTGGETERTLKRRIDLEGVQDPHRFFVLQCCEPTTSLSGIHLRHVLSICCSLRLISIFRMKVERLNISHQVPFHFPQFLR